MCFECDVVKDAEFMPKLLEKIEDSTQKMEELLKVQVEDSYCREIENLIGRSGSHYKIDRQGLLVRVAKSDGAIKKQVTVSMRSRKLHLHHYSMLTGHLGASVMNETMSQEHYWPNMETDVYQVVRECESWVKNRGTHYSHQKK